MSKQENDTGVKQVDPNAVNVENDIILTDAGLEYLREQIAKRGAGIGMRISYEKAGCSGYKYVVDLIDEKVETDYEFPIAGGLSIFVARDCYVNLKGSTVDYVKEGLNKVIRIKNPNETSSCGCGESFNV